ncbi:MAG: Phenylacetic acid catabolic protein [Longimicrobiales bacterium]
MSDYLDVSSLDEAGTAALRRLITSLADTKRLMGIRYSDWLLGAPSIETGIAASSMAQDEWGHARLLYSMLKELGDDPVPVEHDRDGSEYANLGALDEPFPDWAATVAAMVVVDGAISVALDAFARGRFEPAASRCPKMLAEEEFHVSLGAAWYGRLADSSSATATSLLRGATERMLPPVLAWLGASDEAARTLVAAGVTDEGPAQVAAYRDRLRDLVARVGIDIDAVDAEAEWDAGRGRGPGRPGQDAVERARGDLNRALFVE